ncbi:MAG TPA: hypothetical protein VIP46_22545 [Pyrinomonadaceae bacterium]
MAENLEHIKLELEKARIEGELSLKKAELELKLVEMEFRLRGEQKKSFASSPLNIAIISGLIGLLSIIVTNYLQDTANLRVEREKAESALILKAIETGNQEQAAKNLHFLLKIGLIQDKTGRIASLQDNPANAPVLPGRVFDPQKDCGLWQSVTSQKRYTFVCQNESRFDVFENVPEQGLVKVGIGSFDKDNVEAVIIVHNKGRKATLSLKLSRDGKQLEGKFSGEDPREFGQVVFRKIE